MDFKTLPKLKIGDKIAILSPSVAAPGIWPHMYELGLSRVREVFGLVPVEFPATKKVGATGEERAKDLIDAFLDPEIKGVIASLGGDDQVTYIKNLPPKSFADNPKPFFGYSDNSHFCNFLFLQGIPSYYGASLFTQFAMQGEMDEYTVRHIKQAMFETEEIKLEPSTTYNDQGLDWGDPKTINQRREYSPNEGFCWATGSSGEGQFWGGCLESVDEMLRHNVPIPDLTTFENIILGLETSEELPTADYVFRVMRALGERGILSRVQGVLLGRPKAWEFDHPKTKEEKKKYTERQRQVVEETIRHYNKNITIVQNLDFGHTDPQVPMPYGGKIKILAESQEIYISY